MMSYINETDFVIENKELVYPEIITDGLQLYYDAKGKRDTDYHRDTMLDMSGNKNHGKLHNFAYEKHSGYKDGLVFDYIDDKLVRPELNLQPNDFTFMLNGNIISFSPDGTVKRVQNGEVIESKGINLIRNGDFVDGANGWMNTSGYLNRFDVIGNTAVNREISTNMHRSFVYNSLSIPEGNIVYSNFRFKQNNITKSLMSILYSISGLNMVARYEITGNDFEVYSATGPYGSSSIFRLLIGDIKTNENPEIYLDYLMMIDLTETFGAGKEPTKEQMDEIINRLGFVPNAQDLIDRIEYKGNDLGDIENVIDGLYKTDVLLGEEIYTDKSDDAVVHVDVDGKSYQYSEENLFTLDQWNSIPTSEKPKSANVPYIELNLEPNSLYVASTNNVRPNEGTGYYPVFVFPTSQNASSNINGIAVNEPREVVTDSNGILRVAIQFNEPSVRSGSHWVEIKKAPPSPDYPVEIKSLNDFDVVSSVGKENLLVGRENGNYRLNANSSVINPIIYKSYEDYDSVKLTGGTQLSTYSTEFITLKKDKEYVFSMYVYSPVELDLRIGNNASFEWTTVPANRWTRLSRTFVGTGESQRTSSLFSRNEEALNNEIFYNRIKLEEGSLTPYSPAPEDITEDSDNSLIDKINLLLDKPLRSVKDVKDRLFRDSNGLWKIERNVKEFVVNGSERWADWGNDEGTHNSYYVSLTDIDRTVSSSSHFTYNSSEGRSSKVTGINVGGGASTTFNIGVPITIATTLSEWKNWLGNNNVTFTAKLLNPTIETLPKELQDKLNNLRSFEDSNYVYTVLSDESNILQENLKPTLHAKFLYNNWYKEDRVINNLMIYNRALTNEEMIQNYKTIKRRWGM